MVEKVSPIHNLSTVSNFLDGVISIVDERTLEKQNYTTHLAGQIYSIASTRDNLKYIVGGENGFLIYKPNSGM